MSSQLILSIKEAMVRFKDNPIFEDLNFNLHQKSRIALVGKNGSGKTTLMKMIAGEIELEEGERWLENKIEIGYLSQEFVNFSDDGIAVKVKRVSDTGRHKVIDTECESGSIKILASSSTQIPSGSAHITFDQKYTYAYGDNWIIE